MAPNADDENLLEVFSGGANGSFGATDSLLKSEMGQLRRALAADLGKTPDAELVAVGPGDEGGLAWIWAATGPKTWIEPATPLRTSSPLTGGVFADLGGDAVPDLIAATGLITVAIPRRRRHRRRRRPRHHRGQPRRDRRIRDPHAHCRAIVQRLLVNVGDPPLSAGSPRR